MLCRLVKSCRKVFNKADSVFTPLTADSRQVAVDGGGARLQAGGEMIAAFEHGKFPRKAALLWAWWRADPWLVCSELSNETGATHNVQSHHYLSDGAEKWISKSSSESCHLASMCIDAGFSGNLRCPKWAGWHFALNEQSTASVYANMVGSSWGLHDQALFLIFEPQFISHRFGINFPWAFKLTSPV